VLGNSGRTTGIIESEEFVLAAGARFDLLVGGGEHPSGAIRTTRKST